MRYAIIADFPALPRGVRYPRHAGQNDESRAADSISGEAGGGEIGVEGNILSNLTLLRKNICYKARTKMLHL
jgi:hypothetical protein